MHAHASLPINTPHASSIVLEASPHSTLFSKIFQIHIFKLCSLDLTKNVYLTSILANTPLLYEIPNYMNFYARFLISLAKGFLDTLMQSKLPILIDFHLNVPATILALLKWY